EAHSVRSDARCGPARRQWSVARRLRSMLGLGQATRRMSQTPVDSGPAVTCQEIISAGDLGSYTRFYDREYQSRTYIGLASYAADRRNIGANQGYRWLD